MKRALFLPGEFPQRSLSPLPPCLSLLVFLSLHAAPHAAPEPAPWEKASILDAETELFRDRSVRPWSHFLLDGQHAFVAGDGFYQAYAGDAAEDGTLVTEPAPAPDGFLWPDRGFRSIRPETAWLGDTARAAFHGRIGNEVGDPLLGEITGATGTDNHTPLTSGGASVGWKSLRLFAGLDQNDHFSFRTLPRRVALVGAENRERLSWVGGNLPPESQAQLGASWRRGSSLLAVNGNRGWWWTSSPVSGRAYPWEGFNAGVLYRLDGRLDASVDVQEWSLERAGPFYASRFRRYEARLGLPFKLESLRGRVEAGFQRRELDSDSAFAPLDGSGFPAALRYHHSFASGDVLAATGDYALQAESRGSLSEREGLLSARHATGLREIRGPHRFAQEVKLYYTRRLRGFTGPVEYFPEDTALSAAYVPAKDARGWSVSAGYAHRLERMQAGAELIHGMEWGTPLFRGAAEGNGMETLRYGVLGGGDHVLMNGALDLSLTGTPGPGREWRVGGGMRRFYGRDADRMEYMPSPWWAVAGGAFSFPSDLRLEARLHYLGPKRVRGWGGDFRVPSHWENDVGLAQSLFGDRIELTVSALHAFGSEVLERPDGNPLRFRLLVGCRGAI